MGNWRTGTAKCKIGKRNKVGRINDIGMFKIGYTKRSHAVVLKELCCTQFFLSCIFGINKITGGLEEKNCKMLVWKKK